MKLNVAKYSGQKICVCVSGGKDSMALLHYLICNAEKFDIGLCAVNCDHMIRGEDSARDSEFVKNYCNEHKVPLASFKADCLALARESGTGVEVAAREWRRKCYLSAAARFKADAIATAHHMNDNAETVLFNLARGSGVGGLSGISNGELGSVKIIRPLIECTRDEIDKYVAENGVPFVEDETNSCDDYTRNKIRHNVLPELEKAVPSAVRSVYRLSRLAAEDEEFFDKLISENKILTITPYGAVIALCDRVLFRRAAIKAVKTVFNRKDYSYEHAETLDALQGAPNGKRFEFLGLTAYKEDGKVVICESAKPCERVLDFRFVKTDIFGIALHICPDERNSEGKKALKFDLDKIPMGAVIRTRRNGDSFKPFKGGRRSLGDWFTDKKIPRRLRDMLPLIAFEGEILAVCGAEISDKIKTDETTKNVAYIYTPKLF